MLAAVALLAGGGSQALGALPQQSGVVELLTQANLQIDGGGADDWAGYPAAGAGDANGDGIDDVIVASPAADNNGRTDSGSAHVLFGSTSTTTIDLANLGSRGFRVDGAGAGDGAGISARGAGDVDGDGRGDVIVGAYFADHNGRADSGSAYVVLGSTSTATMRSPCVLAPRDFRGQNASNVGGRSTSANRPDGSAPPPGRRVGSASSAEPGEGWLTLH